MLLAIAMKSLVVPAVAWMAALGLRRAPAAARHVVWTAAFGALLALPLLTLLLPAFDVPGTGEWAPVAFVVNAVAGPESMIVTRGAGPAPVSGGPTAAPLDWRAAIVWLWAAGALFGMVRMAVAAFALSRFRRSCRPFAAGNLMELARRVGISGGVDVVEGARGSMPVSFGLFRRTVAMPADAAGWDEERRDTVLLHELAHVRRRDAAAQLVAVAGLSLFWWNPMVWMAWREFLKERERAADDLVLTSGARPSEYARHLLEIASSMRVPALAGGAAVAMARRSQLEGRLCAILDSSANRGLPGRGFAALASAAALAVVLPLSVVRAQEAKPLPEVDATIRAATAQRNFQLADDAARVAAEAGNLDAARKLLETSLAIRGEVSGQQSADYAIGLLRMGELERRAGKPEAAAALYEKSAAAAGTSPRAVPALIKLGVMAAAGKDLEKAAQYLDRARIADPANAQAMLWRAIVAEKQQNLPDADSLFRQAAESGQTDKSEELVAADLYARFLVRQGRIKDAAPLRDRVDALRESLRPAAPPKPAAGVHKIGGSVAAPKLVQKVEPAYSEEARLAQHEGRVVVYTEVGPDGRAHNTRVMRGLGLGLDERAIDAIGQWRFEPGRKDGQPVTVAATIEVNFRLL